MNTRINHGAIVPIERIELLSFTLPTPPPGMKWHRTDGWTAEMLPPGTRPLVKGEKLEANTDSFTSVNINGFEIVRGIAENLPHCPSTQFYRTTRPLLFTHSGNEWQWHRAGDPCPCDGERKIYALYTDDEIRGERRTSLFDWRLEAEFQIIGWRYADEKPNEIPWIKWHGGECPLKDEEVEEWEYECRDGMVLKGLKPSKFDWNHDGEPSDIISDRVLKWRKQEPKKPLGPEDVPPFSMIRRKPEQDNGQQWHWRCVSYVHGVGVQCANRGYKWEELQKDYQINRSIPLTSKWNPDAWEACEK